MEGLQLSETEQRYFGDLFLCCDSENSGKIPAYKASELFRSANLPLDVLKQIFDLSGAGSHASHFGRRQFYAALKLVAASQAGLSLQPELINSGVEVPLPRFSWTSEPVTEKHRPPAARHHISTSPDLIQLSDTDITPTPLARQTTGGSGGVATSDSEQEPSGTQSPRIMPVPGNNGAPSPEASSTASDSPTPTNSVQERGNAWATSAHHHWQGLGVDSSSIPFYQPLPPLASDPGAPVCEEQRQLLGTEEESSDKHSSEEEDEGVEADEVWIITDEQREYYTAQFRALQPDPSGLLAGPVARLFFEKSRLPVSELRKIWQLADVTKDGALSLDEFNTAMHLVVLRRNGIPLPDELPPSLQPPLLNLSTPPIPANQAAPPSSDIAPPVAPRQISQQEDSPPSLSPPTGEATSPPRSKEWTKFVDSPTSSVSSPGPKPVNFDFHKSAVEQDPKILHPVPLRVTPESQSLPCAPGEEDSVRSPRRLAPSEVVEVTTAEQSSPKKLGAPSLPVTTMVVPAPPHEAGEIRPIQRPQPKKPTAPGPGAIPPPPHPLLGPPGEDGMSLSGPASLPMPQMTSLPQGPKKEPPPPPPPRPYRTHTRSSSLDLNKLGKSGSLLNAPPVVPPRVSPSTTSPKKLIGQRSEGDVLSLVAGQPGFADFAQFSQDSGDVELEDEKCGPSEAAANQQPRKHGAFEVYRKPLKAVKSEDTQDNNGRQRHRSDPSESAAIGGQEIPPSELLERKKVLVRLCRDLGRELVALQEERISLELQLERATGAKPPSSD